MDRTTVIQKVLESKKPATYLEIGVQWGKNFQRINAARKIGVDPQSLFLSRRVPLSRKLALLLSRSQGTKFFRMTSDDFFATRVDILNRHRIDVAFIDGLHTYEQSLRDVQHCLKYLRDDGVIVMHDCNPPTAAAAQPTQAEAIRAAGGAKQWCGDVWKTIVHLRSTRPDLVVSVLNCDFGVGVITKGKPTTVLPYTVPQIAVMQYEDLAADREQLLNLKDPAEFLGV